MTVAQLTEMQEHLAAMEPYAADALSRGADADVVSWLSSTAGMCRLVGARNGALSYAYHSYEELILREGTPYAAPTVARPKGIRKGRNRMCFQNAFRAVSAHAGWTYVEGFAQGGFMAVHHAWALDANGTVVETTWAKPGSGYLGIPFDEKTLWRAISLSGTYGVLDDWKHGSPIMHRLYDPDDFYRRLGEIRDAGRNAR